jgi:predicted KAP-like P-loop ATPase
MAVEVALEKTKTKLTINEDIQADVPMKNVPSAIGVPCSKKIKPRALVFKAHDKDLDKIKELIKLQFPDVEVLYVTTGPADSFLRVTKSVPFEMQNFSSRPLYTVEGL